MKTFQFLVAMAVIVAVGGVVNPAFAGMKAGKEPAAAASPMTKAAEKSVAKVTKQSAEKATEKAPRKAAAATKKKDKQGKKATEQAPQLDTGKKTGDRKKNS